MRVQLNFDLSAIKLTALCSTNTAHLHILEHFVEHFKLITTFWMRKLLHCSQKPRFLIQFDSNECLVTSSLLIQTLILIHLQGITEANLLILSSNSMTANIID